MTLQPLQDAGKIRNWAKVERYGYSLAPYSEIMPRLDITFGYMILTNDRQVFEVFGENEEIAHKQAVEFIDKLNI